MEKLASRKLSRSGDHPLESLGAIDAVDAARLIAAASDVAFVVDGQGIIREVVADTDVLPQSEGQSWLNRPLIETVTSESRQKVVALLRDADSKGTPRWRQVNHPSPNGPDVPVRYSAVQIGRDGHIVVIGRDLRTMSALQQRLLDAQLTMEREFSRLRHTETRFRLLFQIASEAILVVDGSTLKIVEANPAADELVGKTSRRLSGRAFSELFDAANGAAVDAMFAALRAAGRADAIEVYLPGTAVPYRMAVSLFRQEGTAHFLVRIGAVQAPGEATLPQVKSILLKVVEKLPDGFVVTGADWRVLTANDAFLDIVGLVSLDHMHNETLERFVGRSGVDFNVLSANLREHGSVRNFSTVMRNAHGASEDVEITAVAALDGQTPCYGFTIRRTARGPDSRTPATRNVPRTVEQLTGLVGRVSLKQLVRESTDIIEKLCIEAALKLTGDNRASAADMLGTSRQSLYVKMHRHGLGDLDTHSDRSGGGADMDSAPAQSPDTTPIPEL